MKADDLPNYRLANTFAERQGFERAQERSQSGVSRQDVLVVVGLLAALYYGYQYIMVHKTPDQLVNKDFICTGARGVPAFQDPHLMAEYLRLNSVAARFAPAEKAVQNAAERDRISAAGLVDLNGNSVNSSLTEARNPLVVHVLETYSGETEVPLLRVRVVNKLHRGEIWYISANDINPLANVTGFADKAAKMHRPGIDDLIESKQGKKVFEKVDEEMQKHR
jgi:hypothetical protein